MANYTTITLPQEITVKELVNTLIQYAIQDKLVCCTIKGITFYSDTISMDTAYQALTGKAFSEHIKSSQSNTSSTKIKDWKDMGHRYIEQSRHSIWDSLVEQIFTTDSNGVELSWVLKLIRLLNSGDFKGTLDLLDAFSLDTKQRTWVLSSLNTLSSLGPQFCAYAESVTTVRSQVTEYF